MNIIITIRIGKIQCRYPSTKNVNGLTINAPFATPSSKRVDLNFAGAADRLLTGLMKWKVKNNVSRNNNAYCVLILIVAFILTLIWMRENINFYRDLYKVEKEENDRLLKENQKQGRTINQNWNITNKRCNKSYTNGFADGRKYERKYGYDQEIKISEEEKAKLEAVIRATINSKKAALGEGCESESEPEAEDKEEEG